MPSPTDLHLFCWGGHGGPFAVPGPHRDAAGGPPVHARVPGAQAVVVLAAASCRLLGTQKRVRADGWQKPANLRACDRVMWGHPGKKLLFTGGASARGRAWNHDSSLDWHLVQPGADPAHASVMALVRDLHALHMALPALHPRNFTAQAHHGRRVGVPRAGAWTARLNSDSAHYGGSNVDLPLGAAQRQAIGAHGHLRSISITLPPLACVLHEWTD